MKRNIITICVAILVFSIFVGQDYGVAQVNTCSECDSRFVNEKGDTIRKLKVKRDLTVKRDLFVDGDVGIGTQAPTVALDVVGVVSPREATKNRYGGISTEASSTLINFGMNEGSENRFGGAYTQADQGGFFRIDTRAATDLFQFYGRTAGTAHGSGARLMSITSTGNVGIGTTSPGHILDVAKRMRVRNDGADTAGIWFADGTSDRQFVGVIEHSSIGINQKWGVWNNNGWRFTVQGNGNVGIGTTSPGAKLEVNGKAIVKVIEIAGADFSEKFDIIKPHNLKDYNKQEDDFRIEPGMVTCIDPENPGKLLISSKAYDRTVAGIISGAGGIRTGMLMRQEGTAADGEYPVALSGRVYCKADATYGPIKPGDTLTTSDTPGYVMKVGDYDKAHGATIGKAMSSLDEGTGLVLTLVSLQ